MLACLLDCPTRSWVLMIKAGFFALRAFLAIGMHLAQTEMSRSEVSVTRWDSCSNLERVTRTRIENERVSPIEADRNIGRRCRRVGMSASPRAGCAHCWLARRECRCQGSGGCRPPPATGLRLAPGLLRPPTNVPAGRQPQISHPAPFPGRGSALGPAAPPATSRSGNSRAPSAVREASITLIGCEPMNWATHRLRGAW